MRLPRHGQDARQRKDESTRKSGQSDQSAPDKSSSEADVFFELMEKGCRTGRTGWDEGVIGKVLMMRSLRTSIQVSMETDPEPVLGFERLLHECKQAMKAQKEGGARDRTATETGGDDERERTAEARQGGERGGGARDRTATETGGDDERERTGEARQGGERGDGARDSTETEIGGNGERERTAEARQGGERDGTANRSTRNESWLQQIQRKNLRANLQERSQWISGQDSSNPALIEFQEFIQIAEREWGE